MAPTKRGRRLTAVEIKTLPPGRHHDGGGLGLYLRVEESGSRQWVQRIVVARRRRELGLGSPPIVSLADAREAALENKRLVRSGRDPVAEKRAAVRTALSFEESARRAHIELSPTWKNPKDAKAFLSTLETYVFPRFGWKPVGDVTGGDVRQAILAVRAKRPEVARKLNYRIAAVLRWAVAEGYCDTNVATAEALALPRLERAPTHRKALPYADVAGCLAAVRASGAWMATKLAIEFCVLTACRSGEVRGARWEEIDLNSTSGTPVWTIPASRMKMKRPHRVPLSRRAVELLREAEVLKDGSGLIFPSVRSGTLSDMTLSKLIKELGFDADLHGFRSSFRDFAAEQTEVWREVAEAALAHKVGDKIEAAYARSDLFAKRAALMQAWSEYLGLA